MSLAALTALISIGACASRHTAEERAAATGLACSGERAVKISNHTVRALTVHTHGYHIQHTPAMIGSVAPGQTEEFTLPDSVLVSAHSDDPADSPPARGVHMDIHERTTAPARTAVQIRYFCR